MTAFVRIRLLRYLPFFTPAKGDGLVAPLANVLFQFNEVGPLLRGDVVGGGVFIDELLLPHPVVGGADVKHGGDVFGVVLQEQFGEGDALGFSALLGIVFEQGAGDDGDGLFFAEGLHIDAVGEGFWAHGHLLLQPGVAGEAAAAGGFEVVAVAALVAVFDEEVFGGGGSAEVEAEGVAQNEEEYGHGDAVAFAGGKVGGQQFVAKGAAKGVVEVVAEGVVVVPGAGLVKGGAQGVEFVAAGGHGRQLCLDALGDGVELFACVCDVDAGVDEVVDGEFCLGEVDARFGLVEQCADELEVGIGCCGGGSGLGGLGGYKQGEECE